MTRRAGRSAGRAWWASPATTASTWAWTRPRAGADYVAFGAFFETGTKRASHRAEPELLTAWQAAMLTPCVAIGGITVETAEGLAQAGADFLAVSAGVWSHPEGPAAAVRAFNAAMARGVAARAA